MAVYYFDSSAVIKLYQSEKGSQEVGRILSEPHSQYFISRLTVVETERAFARRIRAHELSPGEIEELRSGFYLDLRKRRFHIKEISPLHCRSAVRLVRKYALLQQTPLVRSLDALHLAVALDIREREGLDIFVAADKDLCEVAKTEHLHVINPEQSSDAADS